VIDAIINNHFFRIGFLFIRGCLLLATLVVTVGVLSFEAGFNALFTAMVFET